MDPPRPIVQAAAPLATGVAAACRYERILGIVLWVGLLGVLALR